VTALLESPEKIGDDELLAARVARPRRTGQWLAGAVAAVPAIASATGRRLRSGARRLESGYGLRKVSREIPAEPVGSSWRRS
jgi:hypothetical protein